MISLIYSILLSISASADVGKVRIGIVDTGLSTNTAFKIPLCKTGHMDFTKIPTQAEIGPDMNGHGTHVAGIAHQRASGIVLSKTDSNSTLDKKIKKLSNIAENHTFYCFVIYRVYDNSMSILAYVSFLNYIDTHKDAVDIINISISGPEKIKTEDRIIKSLSDSGVKIVVAAGNDSMELKRDKKRIFPAQIDGTIAVGSYIGPDYGGPKTNISKEERVATTNFGEEVDVFMPGYDIISNVPNMSWVGRMTGTSQAAPAYAGDIAIDVLEKKKGGVCAKRDSKKD